MFAVFVDLYIIYLSRPGFKDFLEKNIFISMSLLLYIKFIIVSIVASIMCVWRLYNADMAIMVMIASIRRRPSVNMDQGKDSRP